MLDILLFTIIIFAVYVILDFIWTMLISKTLYKSELGEYIKDRPNYFILILVYLFVSFGLAFFVTRQANLDANISFAILGGLVFGFITSACYALNNLAILKKWSVTVSLIDIAWMSFLSSAASTIAYLIMA